MNLNETHDPALQSWVESANDPASDFPIQNLPFCIFRHGDSAPRTGVGIGDQIFDVQPRDRVPQPLASREQHDPRALILCDVVAVEVSVAQSRRAEVRIVDQRPLNVGRGERRRQPRLPHPLSQP